MGVIKLLECDNCEEVTFKKDAPHFNVRGVNKAEGKVGKLVLCVKCGGELFEGRIKGGTDEAETTRAEGTSAGAAPAGDAAPAPAKAAPAPAKPAPAKAAQAKAS